MDHSLKRGDTVHLLSPEDKDAEVRKVGSAGFSVFASLEAYWWTDRGKTWSSEKLDRMDATKHSFSEAAKGQK